MWLKYAEGFFFQPSSVFVPHQLLVHYMICLPFEQRLNYLLMAAVFAEWGGWWRHWAICGVKAEGMKELIWNHLRSRFSIGFSLKFPTKLAGWFHYHSSNFISSSPWRPPPLSTSSWQLTLSSPRRTVPSTFSQFKYSAPHMLSQSFGGCCYRAKDCRGSRISTQTHTFLSAVSLGLWLGCMSLLPGLPGMCGREESGNILSLIFVDNLWRWKFFSGWKACFLE